ncbi:MAG TPA: hypothetical protein VD770_01835, partial [Coxiellaceae bacterium]|nr:hypothetical protein [Coxiellaceae bacterium]
MPNTKQIINDEVDLSVYPEIDGAHPAAADVQLNINDLHANPIKLLYVLLRQGVISLDQGQYASLFYLYSNLSNPLTAEHYENYRSLLNEIKFNVGSVALVRLMGSVLAASGQNDLLVLQFLKILRDRGVPYEILPSCHDIQFIEAYENNKTFGSDLACSKKFVSSMVALNKTIEDGLITRSEVEKLINDAYKPALKLLSYSLRDDGKAITIYSAATINLDVIKNLAKKLEVGYGDASIAQLVKTIDSINASFIELRDSNSITQSFFIGEPLYVRTIMQKALNGERKLKVKENPFELLLLNKFATELARPIDGAYELNFVDIHGEASNGSIYSLASLLGAGAYNGLLSSNVKLTGPYNVLYSQETPKFASLNKIAQASANAVNTTFGWEYVCILTETEPARVGKSGRNKKSAAVESAREPIPTHMKIEQNALILPKTYEEELETVKILKDQIKEPLLGQHVQNIVDIV